MLMGFLVFCSAFASVFLLGLNSKILRDDHILAGAITSWFITMSQFGLTWSVVHAGLGAVEYVMWSGTGGSIGITLAQYFYKSRTCAIILEKLP